LARHANHPMCQRRRTIRLARRFAPSFSGGCACCRTSFPSTALDKIRIQIAAYIVAPNRPIKRF